MYCASLSSGTSYPKAFPVPTVASSSNPNRSPTSRGNSTGTSTIVAAAISTPERNIISDIESLTGPYTRYTKPSHNTTQPAIPFCGRRYESWYVKGDLKFETASDYPFTAHNTTLSLAAKSSAMLWGFQPSLKDEMGVKKDGGRFDLKEGNDLAELLAKICSGD